MASTTEGYPNSTQEEDAPFPVPCKARVIQVEKGRGTIQFQSTYDIIFCSNDDRSEHRKGDDQTARQAVLNPTLQSRPSALGSS